MLIVILAVAALAALNALRLLQFLVTNIAAILLATVLGRVAVQSGASLFSACIVALTGFVAATVALRLSIAIARQATTRVFIMSIAILPGGFASFAVLDTLLSAAMPERVLRTGMDLIFALIVSCYIYRQYDFAIIPPALRPTSRHADLP